MWNLLYGNFSSQLFFMLGVYCGYAKAHWFKLFCQSGPNWFHSQASKAPIRIEKKEIRLLFGIFQNCAIISLWGNTLLVKYSSSIMITTTPATFEAELKTPTRRSKKLLECIMEIVVKTAIWRINILVTFSKIWSVFCDAMIIIFSSSFRVTKI